MWNAIAEHTVFLRYLIFFVKGIKLVLFYTQAAKNTHTHTHTQTQTTAHDGNKRQKYFLASAVLAPPD